MKGILQHSSVWDRPPASRSASPGDQQVGYSLIPSLEGASVVLRYYVLGSPSAFQRRPQSCWLGGPMGPKDFHRHLWGNCPAGCLGLRWSDLSHVLSWRNLLQPWARESASHDGDSQPGRPCHMSHGCSEDYAGRKWEGERN